jgi:GNAT superfamily N-acetyltransferase
VEIKHEDSFVARSLFGEFELTIMPGNRRVLISQHSLIYPEHRGKGHGRKYLETREEIARAADCNLLLATVRNDNAVEIHLLESHGWKRYNSRDTGVSLWGKEL